MSDRDGKEVWTTDGRQTETAPAGGKAGTQEVVKMDDEILQEIAEAVISIMCSAKGKSEEELVKDGIIRGYSMGIERAQKIMQIERKRIS